MQKDKMKRKWLQKKSLDEGKIYGARTIMNRDRYEESLNEEKH